MSPQLGRRFVADAFVRILTYGGLILAFTIFVGQRRFSAPGWANARDVPGGMRTWAVLLMLAAGLTLIGLARDWTSRLLRFSLTGMGLWHTFFAVVLTLSFLKSDVVAPTGPVAYGTLAALCFWAAAGARSSSARGAAA